MGRSAVAALYVVAMAGVVVGVDVLFFQGHFWERLVVNVGIVAAFVTLFFRLRRAGTKRAKTAPSRNGG